MSTEYMLSNGDVVCDIHVGGSARDDLYAEEALVRDRSSLVGDAKLIEWHECSEAQLDMITDELYDVLQEEFLEDQIGRAEMMYEGDR